jgi:hypothetical protein
MPTVIISPIKWSRSPLLSFLLVLISFSGVLIALNVQRTAVVKDMEEPWATIWGIALALGSATSVIGTYWRDQIDGMLIERSGAFLLGASAGLYSFLILLFTDFKQPLSSIVYLLFSVACFRQVKYINEHLGLIIEALRKSEESDGESG